MPAAVGLLSALALVPFSAGAPAASTATRTIGVMSGRSLPNNLTPGIEVSEDPLIDACGAS